MFPPTLTTGYQDIYCNLAEKVMITEILKSYTGQVNYAMQFSG